MDKALAATLAIVSGIIGLAIVAVLVAPQANTSKVFESAGSALGNVIQAAVSPVTSGGQQRTTAALQRGNFGGVSNASFDVGDALDFANNLFSYI